MIPRSLLLAAPLFAALLSCAKKDEAPADTAAIAIAAVVDSPAASAGMSSATGTVLDPNSATKEQLSAVAGMTPAAADALIAARPFNDMLAVEKVLVAQLPDSAARKGVYVHVFKPIDLNKATAAEILMVPGVGKKMKHEFEEYRPYPNIDKFRREIGKYVDKDEVARMEKYVVVMP